MSTRDGRHREAAGLIDSWGPGLEKRETWGTRCLEEESEKEKTGWLPVFLKAES